MPGKGGGLAPQSKLTPKVQGELVGYLAAGLPVRDACALVGISHQTFYNWVKRGQAEDAPEAYRAFAKAVERAESLSIAGAMAVIIEDIKEKRNVHTAKWYLACKRPQEFGHKARVQADVNISGAVRISTEQRLKRVDELSMDELAERTAQVLGGAAANEH